MPIKALFSLLLLLLTVMTACNKKDACNDNCLHGFCMKDSCDCYTGYTGKWCQTYVGGAASSSSGSSSNGSSGNGPSSSTSGSSSSGNDPGFTFMFWKDFDGPPIKVTLWSNMPGAPVKDITKHYSSVPQCEADGCATFQIGVKRAGILYSATDGTHTWHDTIGYKEACTNIKLEKP